MFYIQDLVQGINKKGEEKDFSGQPDEVVRMQPFLWVFFVSAVIFWARSFLLVSGKIYLEMVHVGGGRGRGGGGD